MSTSKLTTTYDAMWSSILSGLSGLGYTFDPLTTSESEFLATAVSGITSTSVSNLTSSIDHMLSLLAANLTGGSADELNLGAFDLAALIVDNVSGGSGSTDGTMDFSQSSDSGLIVLLEDI